MPGCEADAISAKRLVWPWTLLAEPSQMAQSKPYETRRTSHRIASLGYTHSI
jgi:hypothetical protein